MQRPLSVPGRGAISPLGPLSVRGCWSRASGGLSRLRKEARLRVAARADSDSDRKGEAKGPLSASPRCRRSGPGHGSHWPTAAVLISRCPPSPPAGLGGVSWSSQPCSSSHPSGRSVPRGSGIGFSSDPVILWGPASLFQALLFSSWSAFPTGTKPWLDSDSYGSRQPSPHPGSPSSDSVLSVKPRSLEHRSFLF